MYNTNSDIRFKNTRLKSSLYGYSDAYILVKGTTKITKAADNGIARQADERDRYVIFKNWHPFISYKREMNNTEIDNAKGIGIVMPM